MKKIVLSMVFALFIFAVGQAQTADEILSKSRVQAKAENKNVLLIFHASWCGWCKKLDAGIASPEVKSYFDANFIKVHFTVKEREDKKALETEGADGYLEKFGGGDSGLPFWVVLDSEGNMIASSIVNGENIGCPATVEEVDKFLILLKKTSRNISPNEDKIKKAFVLKR